MTMRKMALKLFYRLLMRRARRQLAKGRRICKMAKKRIREIKEIIRQDVEFTGQED